MSDSEARPRKIIHCDCDCFYASVETRDDASLVGKPLAVGGGPDRRGVLCTANYEARRFGVRSAMPTAHALRLCPDLIVIPPNMEKYRLAAQQVRRIFERYTEQIEPLSLDEAYLDVSDSEACRGSATLIAGEIRQAVRDEVGIAISAGVAPNKFVAKVASDWNKPDGLFVVQPSELDEFVLQLPVAKIHGVGAVTARKLRELGIYSCGDLRARERLFLMERFGRFGEQLYRYARGIDERPVNTSRNRKSLSVEHTFSIDIGHLQGCTEALSDLYERMQKRLQDMRPKRRVVGQFVKLKTHDFRQTTVDRQVEEGLDRVLFDTLLEEAWQRFNTPVRLIGVGVRFPAQNGHGRQLPLFAESI